MLLTLVYMLGQIYNSYWSPSADTDQPDVDRDPEAQTCAICLESINLNAAPAGILVIRYPAPTGTPSHRY